MYAAFFIIYATPLRAHRGAQNFTSLSEWIINFLIKTSSVRKKISCGANFPAVRRKRARRREKLLLLLVYYFKSVFRYKKLHFYLYRGGFS